jgi:hypothetical protein
MPSVTYIDEALLNALAADADIAIQAGNRIFQVQAPQGTALPCIVFSRNTQSRETFGDLIGSSGLTRSTFIFSAISTNLLQVRNLARAIRNVLEYKSALPIRLAVVRSEDEQQEPPASGEQLPIYRTDLSVDVTYTDS